MEGRPKNLTLAMDGRGGGKSTWLKLMTKIMAYAAAVGVRPSDVVPPQQPRGDNRPRYVRARFASGKYMPHQGSRERVRRILQPKHGGNWRRAMAEALAGVRDGNNV